MVSLALALRALQVLLEVWVLLETRAIQGIQALLETLGTRVLLEIQETQALLEIQVQQVHRELLERPQTRERRALRALLV